VLCNQITHINLIYVINELCFKAVMNTFDILCSIYSLLDKKLKLFGFSIFFLLLFTSFVETLSIASIAPVIGSFNNADESTSILPIFNFFTNQSLSLKFQLMVILLLSFSILKTFSLHLLNNFGYKVTTKIEYIILSADLSRVNQRFSPDWKSELNASLTGRIDQTKDSLIRGMLIISASISIFLIILINAFSHPFLILYVSTSLTFTYFLITLSVKEKIRKNSKVIANGKFNRINITNEILNFKKEILTSGISNKAVKRFIQNTKKLRRAEAFGDTISMIPKSWVESIALVVILSSGVYFLKEDSNTISAIGVLAISGQKIITYLQVIFSSITLIRNNSQDAAIISKQALENRNFYDETNICYKFAALEIMWDQIDNQDLGNKLLVKKGNKILISGKSGSGKTMLFESILGLEKCKDIFLDCILERENKKIEILNIVPTKLTSYIPQESYLSDGTILDNILFFQDKIDMEEIRLIFDICGLRSICKFDYINQYKVGDGGKILSGGQKQRVALARALYMKKDLILLDEATSALDKESEHRILSKLINFYKYKTILCISHNKSIDNLFDKKVLINKKKKIII